jgi:hypothetical protein
MAGGRDNFGGKTHPAKLIGDPIGRPMHVVAAAWIGTDAWNPQKLAQFVLKPCGM